MVCMPGKPAYPVLAVCPEVPEENQNATSCRSGHPAAAVPSVQQQERVVTAETVGVGTSSSASQVSGHYCDGSYRYFTFRSMCGEVLTR